MTNDPIKAALVAANVEAARRDAEDMDEDAVRRIIAAFLRALPDEQTHEGGAFWYQVPVDESARIWLAAAVERAAKEARDE